MNANTTLARRLATPDQVEALNAVMAHVPATDAVTDKGLIASLKAHGQLAPILRRGGQIVDGRRRIAALGQLGVEPWIVDLHMDADAGTRIDLLGRCFFELNACRRELSLAVRAAIADALATLKRGDNQHSGIGMSREEAAETAGVSADTLDRFRKVKTDPETHAKVMAGTLSLPQGVRAVEARAVAAKAKHASLSGNSLESDLDQLAEQSTVFNLLYADPPWDYDRGEQAATHVTDPSRYYATIRLDDIKSLPIARIAGRDAVLWLWAPSCYLARAIEVMAAWGFEYVTSAVWVKGHGSPTPGAIRPVHETLLMGRRGKGLITDGAPMLSAHEDRRRCYAHSQKPAHFAQELERLYPDAGKLELFSRQTRPGWVVLGNQTGSIPVICEAANDDKAESAEGSEGGQKDAVKPSARSKSPRTAHKARRGERTKPEAAPQSAARPDDRMAETPAVRNDAAPTEPGSSELTEAAQQENDGSTARAKQSADRGRKQS